MTRDIRPGDPPGAVTDERSAAERLADQRLDDAVTGFYSAAEPRAELLDRLRLLAELPASERPPLAPDETNKPNEPNEIAELDTAARDRTSRAVAPPRLWWRQRAALLGGMVVAAAAALALLAVTGQKDAGSAEQRAMAIAEEIALNHRKRLAVEFRTDAYAQLASQMDKLDFQPIPSELDYQLQGARYCSIQGDIAAQLKLSDRSGFTHTLYQVRWRDRYSAIAGQTVIVDNIRVRFWREGSVFLGLASWLDPPPG
ncbi:MAG: hypothetical protein AAGC55_16865 [Myxococcota bacterium]